MSSEIPRSPEQMKTDQHGYEQILSWLVLKSFQKSWAGSVLRYREECWGYSDWALCSYGWSYSKHRSETMTNRYTRQYVLNLCVVWSINPNRGQRTVGSGPKSNRDREPWARAHFSRITVLSRRCFSQSQTSHAEKKWTMAMSTRCSHDLLTVFSHIQHCCVFTDTLLFCCCCFGLDLR